MLGVSRSHCDCWECLVMLGVSRSHCDLSDCVHFVVWRLLALPRSYRRTIQSAAKPKRVSAKSVVPKSNERKN